VPFEPAAISEKMMARHLKKTMDEIEKTIPFLRESALIVSPNPDALSQDPAFQRYYRFEGLEFIPSSLLAFESGLSHRLDQRDFLDWAKFGLPGLALCSRDVYPLFGTTGEILAAMEMLAQVKKKSERKRP
jgi:hypothetical protein